jgi:hypothetical protein
MPILCTALGVVLGCNESVPQQPAAEPGSKAAAVPAPKDLPKGVKQGPGKAEIH